MEKKDKNNPLRLVIDYCGLNNIIILIDYPILLIRFYFIWMAEGEKWKTVFRYQYGFFKFRVIPMGFINAPGTFQVMINHILHDLLDNGVLVYIDDILIYAETIEEYDRLILDVFKRLRRNNLTICQMCHVEQGSEYHVTERVTEHVKS